MSSNVSSRDLAYSALFGAAALLLPTVFHVVRLGHVFMPMYLPLVALAFFVGTVPAMLTGFIVPVLSSAMTGMPPFYPPVALCMAIEIGAMAGLIAGARQKWPRLRPLLLLITALVLGRFIYTTLAYGLALALHLPAKFVAGLSLLAGWPGIVLMLLVIPAVVRIQSQVTSKGTHT
jgi:thiamine transporter ThiT